MDPSSVQTRHGPVSHLPITSRAPGPAVGGVLTIPISRQRIRLILALGIAFLAVMHVLGITARHVLNRASLYGIIDRFHLDGEANVPALYATLLLLGCTTVVGLIAAGKRANRDPFARHWVGLTLILLFMTADEAAQFHELLTRPMREVIDSAGGWLRYAWVVPGAALSLLVGLAYLRFLLHLPSATARRFVVSGVLFLGSAIGMEMVSGWYMTNRDNDFVYFLLARIEEVLEKIGVLIALDAALAYLAANVSVIRLSFSCSAPHSPPV